MGNQCCAKSGAEFYKSIKYKKYLNNENLNKKYQYKSKVLSKSKGIKTVLVRDMSFSKVRLLKQVNKNLPNDITKSTKREYTMKEDTKK